MTLDNLDKLLEKQLQDLAELLLLCCLAAQAFWPSAAPIAAARAEGRIGGRRKKLDAAKRREIAESVISGRKTGAEMARLYNISAPTVSRIVAARLAGLA